MAGIDLSVLEREATFRFSLSSGPGGQNVNKVNTKVTLRWHPESSTLLTASQKERVRRSSKVKQKSNSENEIVLQVDETRSQAKNKEIALERLAALVQGALAERKKRKPTKPSRAAVARKKREQKEHKEKKARRAWKPGQE